MAIWGKIAGYTFHQPHGMSETGLAVLFAREGLTKIISSYLKKKQGLARAF